MVTLATTMTIMMAMTVMVITTTTMMMMTRMTILRVMRMMMIVIIVMMVLHHDLDLGLDDADVGTVLRRIPRRTRSSIQSLWLRCGALGLSPFRLSAMVQTDPAR